MRKNKPPIGSDLKRVDAHMIQPEEYEEAPEITAEMLDRAELRIGDKVIRPGAAPLRLCKNPGRADNARRSQASVFLMAI